MSPDRKALPRAQRPASQATKTCAVCGRTITWRRKWERDWENVKYCSDKCRGHKPSADIATDIDAALEDAILKLLDRRGAGRTICPSEAARLVSGSEVQADWQPLMQPARSAARRLVAKGTIVITQGGRIVDPSTAKGPIRLRRA
jgi:hypothetical protein